MADLQENPQGQLLRVDKPLANPENIWTYKLLAPGTANRIATAYIVGEQSYDAEKQALHDLLIAAFDISLQRGKLTESLKNEWTTVACNKQNPVFFKGYFQGLKIEPKDRNAFPATLFLGPEKASSRDNMGEMAFDRMSAQNIAGWFCLLAGQTQIIQTYKKAQKNPGSTPVYNCETAL